MAKCDNKLGSGCNADPVLQQQEQGTTTTTTHKTPTATKKTLPQRREREREQQGRTPERPAVTSGTTTVNNDRGDRSSNDASGTSRNNNATDSCSNGEKEQRQSDTRDESENSKANFKRAECLTYSFSLQFRLCLSCFSRSLQFQALP